MNTSVRIGFIMSISMLVACTAVFIGLYVFAIKQNNIAEAKLQTDYVRKLQVLDTQLNKFDEDILVYTASSNKLNHYTMLCTSYNSVQSHLETITIESDAIQRLEESLDSFKVSSISFNDDEGKFLLLRERLHSDKLELNKLKEDIENGKFKVKNNLKKAEALSNDDALQNKQNINKQLAVYNEIDCRMFLLNLLKNEEIETITLQKDNDAKNVFSYEILLHRDKRIVAEVSNQTKRLVSLSRFGDQNLRGTYSNAECGSLAKNFARSSGTEVEVIETTKQTDGTVYVLLAPVVNKVVFYTQKVSAVVSTDYLQVISFDATNYESNHKQKTDIVLKTTLDQAKAILNKNAKVLESKVCVVSILNKEFVTYEFKISLADNVMYIYIDAVDLTELAIKISKNW